MMASSPPDTGRPAPVPTPDSQTFWEGLNAGVLLLPSCAACEVIRFPPSLFCSCGGSEVTWIQSPGAGVVHSFTVVHKAPMPAFAADVPYVVAIVALDEGVRLMTNIVGCDPQDVAIGMPVAVAYEDCGGFVLPMFGPVGAVRGDG